MTTSSFNCANSTAWLTDKMKGGRIGIALVGENEARLENLASSFHNLRRIRFQKRIGVVAPCPGIPGKRAGQRATQAATGERRL